LFDWRQCYWESNFHSSLKQMKRIGFLLWLVFNSYNGEGFRNPV
jgi:hypothetical protein